MQLDDLLRHAVEQRASDIHLAVEAPPVLRIDGRLVRMERPVYKAGDMETLLAGLLDARLRQVLEQRGEVDFSYSLPGVGRFRLNVFRQRGSLGAAVRVIAPKVPDLDELGLPPVVGDLALKRQGLVLVVGLAGSGRSTTLAAMVDRINSSRDAHVITIESPIEYLHRHKQGIVHQREVGNDTGSFAQAVRAALRQDPDVIMVGDLTDVDSITTCLTAAETGRLVLASLHARNAAQTVDRLVEVFPPHQQQQIRVQLAGCLEGIVAQSLVPRANGQGRVAAVEVLTTTRAVRNLIRQGKTEQLLSTIQAGLRYGMQTMEASLDRLVAAGTIGEEVKDEVMVGYRSDSMV